MRRPDLGTDLGRPRSMSPATRLTLSHWAGTTQARSIEISEVPLSQAEILNRQASRTQCFDPGTVLGHAELFAVLVHAELFALEHLSMVLFLVWSCFWSA